MEAPDVLKPSTHSRLTDVADIRSMTRLGDDIEGGTSTVNEEKETPSIVTYKDENDQITPMSTLQIESATTVHSRNRRILGRLETIGVHNTFHCFSKYYMLCFDPSMCLSLIFWIIFLSVEFSTPVLDSLVYLKNTHYLITLDSIIRVAHKCLWDYTWGPLAFYYLWYKWPLEQRIIENRGRSDDVNDLQSALQSQHSTRSTGTPTDSRIYAFPFQWRRYVESSRESTVRYFKLDETLNTGLRKNCYGLVLWGYPIFLVLYHLAWGIYRLNRALHHNENSLQSLEFVTAIALIARGFLQFASYLLYDSMIACFYERYVDLKSLCHRFDQFRGRRPTDASEDSGAPELMFQRTCRNWTDFHDFYRKRQKEFARGFKLFGYLVAILVFLAALSLWVHVSVFLDTFSREEKYHTLWYDVAEISSYFFLGLPVAIYGCSITKWYRKFLKSVEKAEDMVRFDDPLDVRSYRLFEKYVRLNPISCKIRFLGEFEWGRLIKGTIVVGLTKLCYWLFINNVVHNGHKND